MSMRFLSAFATTSAVSFFLACTGGGRANETPDPARRRSSRERSNRSWGQLRDVDGRRSLLQGRLRDFTWLPGMRRAHRRGEELPDAAVSVTTAGPSNAVEAAKLESAVGLPPIAARRRRDDRGDRARAVDGVRDQPREDPFLGERRAQDGRGPRLHVVGRGSVSSTKSSGYKAIRADKLQ